MLISTSTQLLHTLHMCFVVPHLPCAAVSASSDVFVRNHSLTHHDLIFVPCRMLAVLLGLALLVHGGMLQDEALTSCTNVNPTALSATCSGATYSLSSFKGSSKK